MQTTVNSSNVKLQLKNKRGIFYRRPISFNATVKCKVINCTPELIVLDLPQAGPIGFVQPMGSSFTEDSDTLMFQNGLLTDWNTDRKSSVAEIAKLPVEVAKQIITVPSELLTLRMARVDDVVNLENSIAMLESDRVSDREAALAAQIRLQLLEACIAAASGNQTALNECIAE